jgi:imidazole glycerol-phosphate synthase subunit HisF
MKRIIPRLDIKGPNLVKGIHLEGLRVIGKPENFAKYYYEQGADELLYMDVVASLYGRNSLDDIIRRTAAEIFIPLTVGGGIRSLKDIARVLYEGADKVALNTAAIANPGLIKEAAKEFGSATIVLYIEAMRRPDGSYEAYTDNGREKTGVDALQWAEQAEDLGAGEILVTSIDREGTGTGYDIGLVKKISESVSVPVVACGGAGNGEHIYDVLDQGKADGVCIASMLHYDFIKRFTFDDDFKSEGNIEFLKSRNDFKKITPTSLEAIKDYLYSKGIDCRYFVESDKT